MTNSQEILILQIISHNGNITSILKHGFTYSQIFKQIKIFEKEGYIILNDENGSITLTEAGITHIKKINKTLGLTKASLWISPLFAKRVKKIGVNEVYLPIKTKS